ncbi:hypothetical protein RFI_15415 [Reticulomyxa filosa]|uniref:RRM domain-containing protein n=1 Tax=Reticulomyxa filosa TaxID=46433 RepID=X6N7R0_RETFI|nr:hypothetical protein RFI_15415 [Reticulomyxa filosa]|eukprot:ETO21789.1 hypothetical protein RFI_15415 [Reticulomyxa filosa]
MKMCTDGCDPYLRFLDPGSPAELFAKVQMQQATPQMAAEAAAAAAQVNANTNATSSNVQTTTNESAIKNGEINSGGIESLRHENDGTANMGSNEITKENIRSLDMNENQADQSKGNPNDSANEQYPSSRIILLLNMVKESDLEDQKEYQDIMGDIADTCQEYGKLLSIVIPKRGEEGCGRVFLEYQTVGDAKICVENLEGRTFNNNVIAAHFFDEAAFEKSEFGKQL